MNKNTMSSWRLTHKSIAAFWEGLDRDLQDKGMAPALCSSGRTARVPDDPQIETVQALNKVFFSGNYSRGNPYLWQSAPGSGLSFANLSLGSRGGQVSPVRDAVRTILSRSKDGARVWASLH